MPLHSRRAVVGFALTAAGLVGCGGGAPLLHPARTLPQGDVRAASGLSGQVAVGSIAEDLRAARAEASQNPNVPGAPGSDPSYARGALVAAVVAPGLAPFVAARVGIGWESEGGITYTGRGARIDMRKSFELGGGASASAGIGGMAAFYGRQQGSPLPNVDLSSLHGYGADVPLLLGWESGGGLYKAWGGVRAGFEHDTIENLTSEPKAVTFGTPPVSLSATRYYGGPVVGIAAGFRHVHVAFELAVVGQTAHGTYNGTTVDVSGVSLTPATAIWWQF